MTIRAVLFDIGGVLEIVATMDVFDGWAERLGLSIVEFERRTEDIWRGGELGTITLPEVHTRLAEVLGAPPSTVDEMMEGMWVQYLGTLNTPLYEFARGLRPRYRTGILANSFVGARGREQAAYGFEDLVDEIIYTHEVGVAKPDPRVYAIACERLGVEPHEVVFVDDLPANIDAAATFGIRAILYQDLAQAMTDLDAALA
jgi:putative hydrolase of the HAD superfamily